MIEQRGRTYRSSARLPREEQLAWKLAAVATDPHHADPSYAFALSRLDTSDFRHTPVGVFRQVEASTVPAAGTKVNWATSRTRTPSMGRDVGSLLTTVG